MERLTERNESGQAYYKKCFEEPCNGMGERDCDTCEHSYAACERLAEYEDLEITAEQVKDIDKAYTDLCAEFGEYKKLEERGLLLKLPCKVGDKAYHVIKDHLANPPIYISEHEIQDVSAKAVYFADDWWMIEEMPEMNAFLSKEAAEQALKELSGRVNRNGNFTG